jgi:hypothetical protein
MIHSLIRLLERLHGAPVRLQIGAHEIAGIPVAVFACAVGMAHVLIFARIAQRAWPVAFANVSAKAAYLALGYALFGFYFWMLGYLHLWTRPWLIFSGIVSGAGLALDAGWRNGARRNFRVAWQTARGSPLLSTVIALVLVTALVSGLRGIQFDDDYRWQSAVFWTHANHWAKTPYRLTNGPALSELLHLSGAIFGSTTAAHWMSLGLWCVTLLCAAALVRPIGIPSPVAVAACLSVPILISTASAMNSDSTGACFALGGLVFLLCKKGNLTPLSILPSGILFAAVYSAKAVALGCFPAALWLAFSKSGLNWRAALLALCLPLLVIVALWAAHTDRLLGHPFDTSGKLLVRDTNSVMYRTGAAAGRIPHLTDILRLPWDMVLTTVRGQREPFGGRTGVLWLILLPFSIALAWRGFPDSRYFWTLLFVGLSTFFLTGAITLKTRFALTSFMILATLAALVYAHRRRLGLLPRSLAAIAFALGCAIGVTDGCRKLMIGVILDTPPSLGAVQVIADNL